MSAVATGEPTRRRTRPGDAEQSGRRRTLRPVPEPEPEPIRRMPFVMLLVAILGVGMLGLLVLNTTLQGQTFQLRALTKQADLLSNQQRQLQAQVNQLRTPAYLIGRASKLGMVPNPSPAFVILPDGRIVGSPQAAGKGQLPPWLLKTPEQIQRDQAAKEAQKKAEEEARTAARGASQSAAEGVAGMLAAAEQAKQDKKSDKKSDKKTDTRGDN